VIDIAKSRQWRARTVQGEMIVVRYADNNVLGFERLDGALVFQDALPMHPYPLTRFGIKTQGRMR
jgi:hypothetical protein